MNILNTQDYNPEMPDELLLQAVPLLTDWFLKNARELPWRRGRDPYSIWVSEIMLQQTRISAVIPYYERFLRRLPDVRSLADCPEDDLLKLWEGLGYYSRVRNMQKAARVICETYGGHFPETEEELLSLPGIGAYTAGAVGSIAFGLPIPAVDGNVLRVVSRLTESRRDILLEETKRSVSDSLRRVLAWHSALHQESTAGFSGDMSVSVAEHIAGKVSGLFNQAVMELGQVVCLPKGDPLCLVCPLASLCQSFQHGTTGQIPVRISKTRKRVQERTILVVRDGRNVLLRKREERGLLAGMYEIPGEEGCLSKAQVLDWAEKRGIRVRRLEEIGEASHAFSHILWQMRGILLETDPLPEAELRAFDPRLLVRTPEEIRKNYAVPSAFSAFTAALFDGKRGSGTNQS